MGVLEMKGWVRLAVYLRGTVPRIICDPGNLSKGQTVGRMSTEQVPHNLRLWGGHYREDKGSIHAGLEEIKVLNDRFIFIRFVGLPRPKGGVRKVPKEQESPNHVSVDGTHFPPGGGGAIF